MNVKTFVNSINTATTLLSLNPKFAICLPNALTLTPTFLIATQAVKIVQIPVLNLVNALAISLKALMPELPMNALMNAKKLLTVNTLVLMRIATVP